MKVIKSKKELKLEIHNAKRLNKIVGFVPTMGYLHEGHLSLIRRAKEDSDYIVVSIFINPKQFNSQEDFEKYPKDFERDLNLLEQEHVDLVFLPDREEIYYNEPKIFIDIPQLTNKLCGIYRPGHFQGVLLIVLKLFHLVEPHKAYFGKKDYQQFLIIKQMVQDLDLDIDVIGCALIRDSSGLALSSRNARLSERGLMDAQLISRAMNLALNEWKKGESKVENLKEIIKDIIETGSLNKIEYIEIVDPNSLESVNNAHEGNIIAVAVYTEGIRLIDNMELK